MMSMKKKAIDVTWQSYADRLERQRVGLRLMLEIAQAEAARAARPAAFVSNGEVLTFEKVKEGT